VCVYMSACVRACVRACVLHACPCACKHDLLPLRAANDVAGALRAWFAEHLGGPGLDQACLGSAVESTENLGYISCNAEEYGGIGM